MDELTLVIVSSLLFGLGIVIGYYIRQSIARKRAGSIEAELKKRLEQTKKNAENIILKARERANKIEVTTKSDLEERQKLVIKAEERVFKKEEILEEKEKTIKKDEESLKHKIEKVKEIKKQTKLDVPITLIEREQQALLENLKNRVSYELQISFEEYLKQAQKTEDQLKKGFEDIAKERVKGFLILHAIEKKENITVTKEEIDEKSKDKDQNLRYYIEDQLKKEKIFNILGC
jgi:hypothetical protein